MGGPCDDLDSVLFPSTCIVDNLTKEVFDSRTGCTEAATSAEMLLELKKLKKARCEVHYMQITVGNTLFQP